MLVSPGQYLAIFLITGLTSFALTPFLRNLANKLNWVDKPNLERKDQTKPIPYLGGIAVFIGFSVLILGSLLYESFEGETLNAVIGMWVPAAAIAVVGLVDDIRNLTAKFRLIAQSFAALIGSIALTLFGTASYLTENLFVDSLLLLFWIVTLTNAMNLLDNMDGLATGIAGTAGFGYFAIGLLNGQYFVSALALALTGALFGFWFWNRNPARIYLGDAGALFIGFMLGVISIRINLTELPKVSALLVPLLVLMLPLLDTAVVVFTRVRRKQSIFEGGRDHLSHRLVRYGYSKTTAVNLLIIGNSAIGLVMGIASYFGAGVSLGCVILVILFGGFLFNWFIKIPDTD